MNMVNIQTEFICNSHIYPLPAQRYSSFVSHRRRGSEIQSIYTQNE